MQRPRSPTTGRSIPPTARRIRDIETYYSLNAAKGLWLTADYQRVRNPAYNADRGPLDVLALRLHGEF